MPPTPPPPHPDDLARLAHAERALTRRGVGDGVVYTPLHVALPLVHTLLDGGDDLLDPACGTGVFLLAAARILWARAGATSAEARASVLRARVRGLDHDPRAVAAARGVLADAAGVPPAALAGVVEQRDALADPPPAPADVVVCNPPWIEASRLPAALRSEVRARFEVARGNWDLWCPFVERALACTRPGGRLGLLLPDKLLSAEFAAAVRAHLTASCTLEAIEPLGEVFPGRGVRAVQVIARPRARPARGDPSPWSLVTSEADERLLTRLTAMPTLGTVADVYGAATVAEAYAWRPHLRDDASPDAAHRRVLNSGTIDPDHALWGARPMRYLGGAWRHPVLPVEAVGARRRAHADACKLVVASMTRRLEAVVDTGERWLAAKSTSVVLPGTAVDARRLGLWLHSDLASRWYTLRFGGLAFRGGHLRVGPPQLRQLPVPSLGEAEWRAVEAAARRGRRDAHLRDLLELAP